MMNLDKLELISWLWMGLAGWVFVLLIFVTAPYGRHTRSGWGPLIDNRLGWILMEAPSFFIILYCILRGNPSAFAIFLGSLWLLHYGHRSFIYPFRIRTQGKKMPLSIVLMAVFFNGMNAGLNGYFLGYLESYSGADFLEWTVIVGFLLFVVGAWINIQSDSILIRLRSGQHKGYQIPYGGFFRWVSCPNFLGEIIEWAGFALMAWNLPALSFFVWTLANVVPRAIRHHQWYQNHFEAYPQKRKAIIPFLL